MLEVVVSHRPIQERTELPTRSCTFAIFESWPIPNWFPRYSKTSVSLRDLEPMVRGERRRSSFVAAEDRVIEQAQRPTLDGGSPEDRRKPCIISASNALDQSQISLDTII